MKGTSRGSRVYRGSKRRVRAIRLKGNASVGMWLVLTVVVVALCGLMPWLMMRPS